MVLVVLGPFAWQSLRAAIIADASGYASRF